MLGCLPGIAAAWAAAPAWAVSATLSGSVEYEAFAYPEPKAENPNWENFFAAVLRAKTRLTEELACRFELRAVADDAGFTAGAYSLRNAGKRRPYLSLIEALVNYHPLPELRLTVGKQIANWSIIDRLHPANLVSPTDRSDPFRPVDQGVPAVSLHYEREPAYVDLIVVPLAFNPSRLPQGRWGIIPGTEADEVQQLPPVRFDETQAGVRIGAHVGRLDASLIGYVGRDSLAIFVPRLIFVGGDEPFELQIIDRYPKLRAGGFNASYPLGEGLLLRAEVVYFTSPDDDRGDFVQPVVGAEYSFGDWRFVLNYLRDEDTARATQEVTDQGQRRFFRNFLFGGFSYDDGGRLRASIEGGYDFRGEFWLFTPEVSYRVWRNLRVALVADIIGASGFSYFDRIRHEDRVGLRLKYDVR